MGAQARSPASPRTGSPFWKRGSFCRFPGSSFYRPHQHAPLGAGAQSATARWTPYFLALPRRGACRRSDRGASLAVADLIALGLLPSPFWSSVAPVSSGQPDCQSLKRRSRSGTDERMLNSHQSSARRRRSSFPLSLFRVLRGEPPFDRRVVEAGMAPTLHGLWRSRSRRSCHGLPGTGVPAARRTCRCRDVDPRSRSSSPTPCTTYVTSAAACGCDSRLPKKAAKCSRCGWSVSA